VDLRITKEQFDAIEFAKHLPDVLQRALDQATRAPDGYVLHLSYEEATALNELCSWNVHTGSDGAVTPETRVFDELVKAIITHPDF
jgi:hypothetical protein